MGVTINDAILLGGSASGVDTASQGTQFSYDNGDFVGVLDNLLFEGDAVREAFAAIGIGATVEVDGISYTLESVFDFWAKGETINLDTGETASFQGQFMAFTLIDDSGNTLNFLAPGNTLTSPDAGWTGDPINSITVFSQPTAETEIPGFPNADGVYENKLGNDDDVKIPCFAAGTLIDTLGGPVAVEALRPGDMVLTRDNGYLPLRWAGRRSIDGAHLAAHPEHASVRIAAGALGGGLPARDMRVSPQHRMLLTGPRAELMFGEREVLVPAVHMVGLPGITRDAADVTYVHILFDSHEIVRADGAWSESFQPADWSMGALDAAQRNEILALFPELARQSGCDAYVAARMTLKPHEARALLSAA